MSSAEIVSWSYEFKAIEGFAEGPSITKLQMMPDGSFVAASAFAKPLLSKFTPSKSPTEAPDVENMNLEAKLGDDAIAVVGGLHESEFGDIDLSVVHGASKTGWMKRMLGKDFSEKTGANLVQFLDEKGEGSTVSTSHLQYKKGKYEVRRFKEPGLLWDLWFLGDYVFGLTPSSMWRERYLHMQLEKRESVRGDLMGNFQLHRDPNGTIWSLMENGRLARFEYTENKAKPTLKKLPGMDKNHGFERSAASKTDGWLYGVSGAGTELFRVRRNTVSFEEEIQLLLTSKEPITALTAVDREEAAVLIYATEAGATEGEKSAELYTLELIKPEDEELLPEIPTAKSVGKVAGVSRVSSLTWDWTQKDKTVVWGAEGYFGADKSPAKTEKLSVVRVQL